MTEWTSGNTTFRLDLEAGTFVAEGELDFRVEREFQHTCARLLDSSEARPLLVDLAGVEFMCSSCLGSLFLLHDTARTRGVEVRVRLSRKVAPICRMMGLDELMDIEVA